MNDFLFNETVKSLTSLITGKQKRAEVEQELLCHLEDTYERNIATGKSEEEAKQAAVNSLGDLNLIREQLGKLHSFSHARAASTSIYIFIASFLLIKFNILPEYEIIRLFIAYSLMLFALVRLYSSNKFFRISFFIQTGMMLTAAITQTANIFFDNQTLIMTTTVLQGLAQTAFWLFSFSGFKLMFKTHCNTENKKVNLTLPQIVLTFGSFCATVIVVANKGKTVNFEMPFLSLVLLGFYIYCIIQLIRLSRRLWDADAQYGVSRFKKSPLGLVLLTIITAVALPTATSYIYSTAEPVKSEFVMHDTSDANAAEKSRKNMLSLGFPEEFLNELPDSEVMRCSEAKFMSRSEFDDNFNAFTFAMPEGKLRTVIRVDESYRELSNKKAYLGGIYLNIEQFQYNSEIFPLNVNSSEFFIQCIEKNSDNITVQKVKKQITPANEEYYPNKGCFGAEFTRKDNQTVWFGISYALRTYTVSGYPDEETSCSWNLQLSFVEQTLPVNILYSSLTDFEKNQSDYGYKTCFGINRTPKTLFCTNYYYESGYSLPEEVTETDFTE